LLEFIEYKKIALRVLQQLVIMTIMYMSKKGFSCLVQLKTKKRNALIHPQLEKLITAVPEQRSH